MSYFPAKALITLTSMYIVSGYNIQASNWFWIKEDTKVELIFLIVIVFNINDFCLFRNRFD